MPVHSLRSSLLEQSRRQDLSQADRDHINRWLVEAKDPAWTKLAEAILKANPGVLKDPYLSLIKGALSARQYAESQTSSPAIARRERQKRKVLVCSNLRLLAKKMEDVAEEYMHSEWAQFQLSEVDSHLADTLPPEQSALALEWLRHRATDLLLMAGRLEKREASDFYISVSRQGRGRRLGVRAGKIGTFVRRMVDWMVSWTQKPRHSAVAAVANIAFPGADLLAEDVRSFCRPTTRAARRGRKTGAHRRRAG
jgi:hypothetical protein